MFYKVLIGTFGKLYMAIENLKFQKSKYPKVLHIVNRLAELEQRRPHDTAKRLILEFGEIKIAEILSKKSLSQPA